MSDHFREGFSRLEYFRRTVLLLEMAATWISTLLIHHFPGFRNQNTRNVDGEKGDPVFFFLLELLIFCQDFPSFEIPDQSNSSLSCLFFGVEFRKITIALLFTCR